MISSVAHVTFVAFRSSLCLVQAGCLDLSWCTCRPHLAFLTFLSFRGRDGHGRLTFGPWRAWESLVTRVAFNARQAAVASLARVARRTRWSIEPIAARQSLVAFRALTRSGRLTLLTGRARQTSRSLCAIFSHSARVANLALGAVAAIEAGRPGLALVTRRSGDAVLPRLARMAGHTPVALGPCQPWRATLSLFSSRSRWTLGSFQPPQARLTGRTARTRSSSISLGSHAPAASRAVLRAQRLILLRLADADVRHDHRNRDQSSSTETQTHSPRRRAVPRPPLLWRTPQPMCRDGVPRRQPLNPSTPALAPRPRRRKGRRQRRGPAAAISAQDIRPAARSSSR